VTSNIVNACSGILTRIKNAFSGGVSSLISIGSNLAGGIWTGLQNAASNLYSKITNMCNNLWSRVKNFFGISSPSQLFRDTIGANLALGLGEGFVGEMNDVAEDMQSAVPTTLNGPSVNVGGVVGGSVGSGSAVAFGTAAGPLITIQQMIVRSEEDIRAISQQLYNMMQQSSRAQGYFTTA
jgi:hypothetical protein